MRPRDGVLQRLVRYLRLAQNIYYMPFVKHIGPLVDTTVQDHVFARLQQSVHAVISYSFPGAGLSSLLTEELTADSLVILGVDRCRKSQDGGEGHTNVAVAVAGDDDMDIDQKYTTSYEDWKDEPSSERRSMMMSEGEDIRVANARSRVLQVLEGLQSVGLGGRRVQRIFAEVMNGMMTEFVASTYASQWSSPSLAAEHLQHWIEDVFSRLVAQVLHVLKPADDQHSSRQDDDDGGDLIVTLGDVEKWQEMGMARLGSLRIGELFDIIVEWDASTGAIEDLRHYIANPATRFLLTSSFLSALSKRLLHPGASTVEILQVYISIIRAFGQLDPRGVLLDRIAKPIRRYLKDRDDTVKVIVTGLLSESTGTSGPDGAASSNTEALPEIAHELTNAHQLALREDSGELDWDDMNWTPDPVDAALDYKKSKTDVIGSLISLFDTKDVVVKELQKALSERLLKKNREYDLEISVLELLKIRFGDASLQACEIMLRDVLDSKRVDSFIRSEQKMSPPREDEGDTEEDMDISPEDQPELHAKILSRLYWPIRKELAFKVPDEVRSLQGKYSAGFQSLKPSRKLTWLNALGRVTVELDLEDRLFQDEVTTWQATVIYAFQSLAPPAGGGPPVTKTVAELAEQLDMPTTLVRSACLYWLSKRVLTEVQPGAFQVLETLLDDDDDNDNNNAAEPSASHIPNASSSGHARKPRSSLPTSQTTAAAAAAAAVAAQEAAAKESADAETLAKMDFYWQFIVGMLTNQGAMPLQGIIMMLKMVVPGGFPFGSEELKDFLGQKVAQGQLEKAGGGNYKIVK